MKELANIIFTGKIKSFTGQFGFIEAEFGDIFFHKTALKSDILPNRNERVEFRLRSSLRKAGKLEAYEIVILEKGEKLDDIISVEEYILGTVKWYNSSRGFGILSANNIDYFIHVSNILMTTSVNEGDAVIFLKTFQNGKLSAIKCQPFVFGLNNCSLEKQAELLQNYLVLIGSVNPSIYDKIKSIAQSDKIKETVKFSLLKSVFEKATEEYLYEMLFDDLIIFSEDNQNVFAQEYLLKLGGVNHSNYDKIKSIAQSDKIKETLKGALLKSAFKDASTDYQFQMLFRDNLFDIQKETNENQIEILQNFFFKLDKGWNTYSDYFKIEMIAKYDKIKKTAKFFILKFVFEKADPKFQFKMLNEGLIILSEEKQIEILRKYISVLICIGHVYNDQFDVDNYLEYAQLKSIAQSGWIEEKAKDTFLKLAFEKADKECKFMMLIDGLITLSEEKQIDTLKEEFSNFFSKIGDYNSYIFELFCESKWFEKNVKYEYLLSQFELIISQNNFESLYYLKKWHLNLFSSLFEKSYPQISKINRLRLWLQNYNPYYNYIEFVQVAWQLSNDERKLLNKRIKEFAKDERLQSFLDQIPVTELIVETKSSKTYKCKWRNIYYNNGSIQVFFDKYTSSEDYLWESAREEWNLLTQEYFNRRRIDDVITTVNSNNQITKISGLEDIEVKIVIAEVHKNGATEGKTNITSSQISKIIHNISARNQCINFLASQSSVYNVLDIQELVTDDYGSLRRDVSFIFPIPNTKGNVYLIWESAEFEKSKATHIFKCSEEELENAESKIKDFIESNLRTRSRLNSVKYDDIEVKRELQYFCRVNHDTVEYQVWENRMREVLPFLK